jgi:hypothetical protein
MGHREDGLTDENLFRLRINHPYLNVKKFTARAEALNGADWEWWIGSRSSGWLGLRVQAKKMLAMRYDELGYRSRSQTRIQCQVLVEETAHDARGRALYPLYVFYNGWDEAAGWPAGVAWTLGCSKPANCKAVPDVSIFGCGLADARQVLAVLQSNSDPLAASSTLPLQRPWSWLFKDLLVAPDPSDVDTIQSTITAALGLNPNLAGQGRYEVLPEYAEAVAQNWPEDDVAAAFPDVPVSYVVTTDLAQTRQ